MIFLIGTDRVQVDKEDYPVLRRFTWAKQSEGYYRTSMGNFYLYLHRLIMGAQTHLYVDHINRNKKDNRKKNLRIVTNSQNQFNRKNTFTSAGVGFHRLSRKWRARITLNQSEIYLGLFKTKKQAIEARRKALEDLL